MKDELKLRWTPVRKPESDGSGSPPPSTTDSKISGYLNKQGEKGLVKTWKKRWFVFDKETGELFYHLSETTPHPIGGIDIQYCEVHRNTNPSNKREFTLHYTTTGRIYYLIAASEQEVGFWVSHFMEWKARKKTVDNNSPSRGNSRSLTFARPKNAHTSISPPPVRATNELFARSPPSTTSLPLSSSLSSRNGVSLPRPSVRSGRAVEESRRASRWDEEKKEKEKEEEGKKMELLDELSQRLTGDVQDVHSVRALLSSFHRPLTASVLYMTSEDTQYLSQQLIRQMEYLNLVLQEVSQTVVKEEQEEKADSGQDEYQEEEITGHFFLLPSGLAYYLFSFLEPADLSRACQVCRTWRTYAENPSLWAQFMATPSSKYDNLKNWKSLYISTQQQPQVKVRAVSIYGMPPTSFVGSVKEGWLHKRSEDLLRSWKRRWFVIRENCLIYYKTPKDNLPCGVIPLSELNFALVKGTGRKHCFKLSNQTTKKSDSPQSGVEIMLSADSDEECLAWVSELRNMLQDMVMRRASKIPDLQNLSEPRTHAPPPLTRSISHMAFTTPTEKLYPYFGVSLSVLMTQQQQSGDETKIPSMIDKAITCLTEKALDEEGLLRVSGSLSEIQSMRAQLEQGKELDFAAHDPHAVAGLVKSFFRELPERLIPADLNAYAATVAAETSASADGVTPVNVQQKIDEFRFIIQSLPVHNHNLFRAIVANHSEKNKMNENNILRVIIPTIHCNPQLLAYSMRHFNVIFNKGYL